MTKFTAIAAVVFASVASFSAAAGWSNIYADYYNHEGRTTDKVDTYVLGIEGGYASNLVDMYGFYEYDTTNKSTFAKASSHFKVLPWNLTLYAQATDFQNDFGGETTSTLGVGYLGFGGDNWSFKPYVGYTTKGGNFAGDDNVQVGWSAFWSPSEVYFSNWTDIELAKDKDEITVNGGLGAWYDITPKVYTGVQYTYSYKTVGELGYGDSVGIRIGYKF